MTNLKQAPIIKLQKAPVSELGAWNLFGAWSSKFGVSPARPSVRGFTLLFASLVSSLLLAVGVAIFDVTIKEVILASTARDSSYAIYTADTGLECAFYWDFKNAGLNVTAFATSSQSSPNASIACNNQTITPTVISTLSAATTTFTLTMAPQPYCATVIVAKYGNPTRTTVASHGYNTCNANDPRRIERALQANY